MKRPDLLILVAIWEFIAAFIALIGFAAVAVFGALATIYRYSSGYGFDRTGYMGTILGLSITGLVLFIYIGVAVAGGIGVLIGKEWGRIISIVQAALSLFSIPFGTVIGVLILVYLTRAEVRNYFIRPTVPPATTPVAPPEKPAP